MRLDAFSKKKVYVCLVNGWAYTGEVIDCTEDSITLIDKKGENVYLSRDAILTIREVNSYGN